MPVKLRFPLFAVALILCAPAVAYETLEQDFAICTEGQGTNPEIVAACTRLIDNAETENEMVGFFYGLRASANTDSQMNCADAQKVLQLTDDPQLIEAAETLIEANC